MNVFTQIINNKCVYLPICLWAIVQVMKLVIEYIKTKKINFRRLVGAGGMPSSHSAIVCCLASCIGKQYGFSSGIFAIVDLKNIRSIDQITGILNFLPINLPIIPPTGC